VQTYKYSYEFKIKCVEMYKKGQWMDTPEGVKEKKFHAKIRRWYKLEQIHGPEILKPRQSPRHWTAEEKYKIVSKVVNGSQSLSSASIYAAITENQLERWVSKYKLYGYNGLKDNPKGLDNMKDKTPSEKLNETEREELIRLREENKCIKAEISVIKKEIALREKRNAAQLKAKKQQSSKNSKKKDTN
jgi:transposase